MHTADVTEKGDRLLPVEDESAARPGDLAFLDESPQMYAPCVPGTHGEAYESICQRPIRDLERLELENLSPDARSLTLIAQQQTFGNLLGHDDLGQRLIASSVLGRNASKPQLLRPRAASGVDPRNTARSSRAVASFPVVSSRRCTDWQMGLCMRARARRLGTSARPRALGRRARVEERFSLLLRASCICICK